MKTAVVIFSRNAASSTDWERVLQAHAMQDIGSVLHLLVDSESSDTTVCAAEKYGWKVITEKAAEFNHGLTRQKVVDKLQKEGFDAVIFATQDVIPENSGTLSTLLDALVKEHAAAAYSRQMPLNTSGLDSFLRLRNYPAESRVKSSKDIPELGIMTPFCSNSLAVWDLKKVSSAGGFPETRFGEDMLMASKLIMAGEKILYCAESRCFHEHSNSLKTVWHRGLDIGAFHAQYPELQRDFGTLEACAKNHIPLKIKLRYFFQLAVKYLAFRYGYVSFRRK